MSDFDPFEDDVCAEYSKFRTIVLSKGTSLVR